MNSEERSNEREAIRQRSQRLHATGTGNALVVADDVRSLLDSLAAVERERDQLRDLVSVLNDDADQALIDRDEAIEAESQVGDRIATERDAALARIAAVDDDATYDDVYTELSLALGTDDSADEDVDFKRDLTVKILRHFRAALAASPTPTGPEPATETRERHRRDECSACWMDAHGDHDVGWRHEDGSLYSATCHDCNVTYRRPGPATPTEPTEQGDVK